MHAGCSQESARGKPPLQVLRRKGHHLVDLGGIAEEHDEAVDAERVAGAGRHALQRVEEPFRKGADRPAGVANEFLLGRKPSALLGRVVQLAEAVAQLEPADVKLEALGHRGLSGFRRASDAFSAG